MRGTITSEPLQVPRNHGSQKLEGVPRRHCVAEDVEQSLCRGTPAEVHYHLHGPEQGQQIVTTNVN